MGVVTSPLTMKLTLLFGLAILAFTAQAQEVKTECVQAIYTEVDAQWDNDFTEENQALYDAAVEAVNAKNQEIADSITEADVIQFEKVAERLGQEISDKFATIKQFQQ